LRNVTKGSGIVKCLLITAGISESSITQYKRKVNRKTF
jgi:hypothetical protein